MKYTLLISAMLFCSVCYGQKLYRTTIDTQVIVKDNPSWNVPTDTVYRPVYLTKTDSANIKELQGIISFTGGIKQSFDGLIEAWYCLCRQNRKSEKLAYLETLGKIATYMENLARHFQSQTH